MTSKSNNRKTVEGDFSAPEIEQIHDRRIEGSFSTDQDEQSNYIKDGIKNSEIVGVYDTIEEPLRGEIEDSHIHADIDATHLLSSGKNSIATGGHITTEGALSDAKQSLILGDTVQVAKGGLGNRDFRTDREHKGNVVAGRDVKLGPRNLDKLHWSLQEFHPKNLFRGKKIPEIITSPLIEVPGSVAKSIGYALELDVSVDGQRLLGFETPEAEGMPVISEGSHPDEDVTEYHGDWNQLSHYLMDRVPEGDFEAFELFNLPNQLEDVNELDEVVTEVKQKYSDIEDQINTIHNTIGTYDLPELKGTNQEIFDRITDFQELTQEGDEITIRAYDDPDVDGLVYEISSSSLPNHKADQFRMRESPEAFTEAIEQSPLESEEAGITLSLLDVPELESAEELLYELQARDIIGSDIGEAYKFVDQFSDEVKLELPWEEKEGLKSRVKSLFGISSGKDQREIYSELREVNSEIEYRGRGAYIFANRFSDDLKLDIPWEEEDELQVGELSSKLKEIDEKFDFERVQEARTFLRSMTSEENHGGIDYQLSGSTDERYQQLLNIEEELMEHVEETWDLGEEAMEVVEEGNTNYLMRTAGNASDYEGGGVEEFLLDFQGGKPDRVLEPGFSSTKFADGEDVLDNKEEAIDAAYSQGVDMLRRLANDQGTFQVNNPEIEKMENRLEELIEIRDSIDGKPTQDERNAIEEINNLKSEIPEKRREVAFKAEGLEYGEEADYSDIDSTKLRNILDQLGQEYLESEDTHPESGEINPTTVAGKARDIANQIDISGDVGNGYVDFEVYDKNIMNLPSDDRQVPCTFPGGSMDHEFIDYMKDPGTQIALLESGEDRGAVISHPVKQEGQDYLLIHSVESNDGITSRNDLSMAIREQIEEYASEADMEGVIYSTSAHNTAAGDFIEAAVQQDPEYHEQTYTVDKKGSQDVHLDFSLPEVQGYKVEVGESE